MADYKKYKSLQFALTTAVLCLEMYFISSCY